jgi:hypothetical protein
MDCDRVRRGGVMQSFVHRKNLEHFRKLLANTTDDAERRLLMKLLEDERSKDKAPKKAKDAQQES